MSCKPLHVQPAPKCYSAFVRTRPVKAVAVAVVEMAAMVVVDVAPKAPVVTVVAMVDKAAAVDAVANTHPVHKAHAVPKAMAVATAVVVKAVDAHPWETRNRVAMKADLAAAWASALRARRQVVNPTLCAPVSI